jgi:hypothetical protein
MVPERLTEHGQMREQAIEKMRAFCGARWEGLAVKADPDLRGPWGREEDRGRALLRGEA